MKLPKLEMQDYLVLAALGGLAYIWYKTETAPALAAASPSSGGGAPRTGTTTVTTPGAPAQVSQASTNDPGIGSNIFSNSSSALPGFGDS